MYLKQYLATQWLFNVLLLLLLLRRFFAFTTFMLNPTYFILK